MILFAKLPRVLDDPKLLVEKLAAVMSGHLLVYQDGDITFSGDPGGKCKVTVYFGGVEGWTMEILPGADGAVKKHTVLINGIALKEGIPNPTPEQINAGLVERLERLFGMRQ